MDEFHRTYITSVYNRQVLSNYLQRQSIGLEGKAKML